MNKLASRLQTNSLVPGMSVVYLGFGLLFAVAMIVRASLYHIVTGDYTAFLSRWYDFIQSHGGFAALKYDFSNYNPPYLYLLAIATYLPIPKLIAIKSISVVFDVVLALFTYLILRLKYRHSYVPLIGALVLLFAPTVVINSSAWGQCDAIYAAFCIGSLYFLCTRRWAWACIFFGVALGFKLQAIFFLPVVLLFALRRTLPLRYLLLIPAVFVLLLVPAYVAGRDVGSLLSIYTEQMSSGGVGGGMRQFQPAQGTSQGANGQPPSAPGTGQSSTGTGNQPARPANGFGSGSGGRFGGTRSFGSLTYNAPTIYQWFTGTSLAQNKWVGIGLAALAVALVGAVLLWSKTTLTPTIGLHISLVCVLAIPFFLPEMHERYFYLADVISIMYAFYVPRAFYIPVIMQIASLLSYAPYMMHTTPINLSYVAFGVLAILLVAAAQLVTVFRRNAAGSSIGLLPRRRATQEGT